ncbi:hypothetical protein [Oceanispirochaeta sp. M1]|uniref:hypothetical protein n=1 Tax=Oceanispirochaeta sp. M1 TaxID=2283433 RepID=UPI001F417BED|nr:hypothetical protein [Oceanispirochaeta sp. M1]
MGATRPNKNTEYTKLLAFVLFLANIKAANADTRIVIAVEAEEINRLFRKDLRILPPLRTVR